MRLNRIIILLTSLFVLLYFQSANAQKRKFKVVLDAGHGGKDPGAVGSYSKEKDIVLAVVKKVGRLIDDNHSDVEVIYTRNNDTFIPLNQRANIANDAKANLFMSFHCNAMGANKPSPPGAETFILGLHRSKDNLDVAKKENSVILYEDNYSQKYQGFNPNEPESYIIFEFMSNQFLKHSLYLATLIQHKLVDESNRVNRSVRQAGFLVLREVAMPSVLIEMGYISNRSDEEFLASESGKNSLANSIYKAFTKFKREYDKNSIVFSNASSSKDREQTVEKDSDNLVVDTDNNALTVQFLTSENKLNANSSVFRDMEPVYEFCDGKRYKYSIGASSNETEVFQQLKNIQKKYPDSFVTKLNGAKRIK